MTTRWASTTSPRTTCRWTQAPDAYADFQAKKDGMVKVVLKPGMAATQTG